MPEGSLTSAEQLVPGRTLVDARLSSMLERAQARALPIVNRTPDFVPAAQGCCGVCRTCATTNVLTLAGAALVASTTYGGRIIGRIWPRGTADGARGSASATR